MYSKNAIRIYSFLISIVITFFIQQSSMKVYELSHKIKQQIETQEEIFTKGETEETEKAKQERQEEKDKEEEKEEDKETWQLMIPKIDLIAPIQEGIEQSTMKKAIGHFPGTGIWEGNIGLASHNRGVRSNFFENIKQLIKGDIIIYQKGEQQKQYTVETVVMIVEQDWSYLQNTEDNRITLITCVTNQPDYRLCVQAKEN